MTAAPTQPVNCAELAAEPIEIICRVLVAPVSARDAVSAWLIAHVGTAVYANAPRLQILDDRPFWEVPLTVNLPSHPPGVPFHAVRVDALNGTLLLEADEAEAIRRNFDVELSRLDPQHEEWWQSITQRRAGLHSGGG